MATAEATSTAISICNPTKDFKNTNSDRNENDHESMLLLPGLPNHLAQLCLSSLHPSLLHAVCRSWRCLIYSPSFPPFFSLYALLSPTIHHHQQYSKSIEFFSLDPVSSAWRRLPSPPPPLCLLHRHPSFISRTLPIQSLTVAGRLVLIAATDDQFLPALSSPLVFDPLSNSNHWFYGPPLPTPRRWCAAGSMGSATYVASGIGSHYQSEVAQSMEKWDMNKKDREWKWEKMAALKDSSFSREDVQAIGYRGKLCMVNVKGKSVKQGSVYDVAKDQWDHMPEGMLAGWRGAVAATVDGGDEMFVVDEERGELRRYDADNDTWEVVLEESELLKGAEQIVAGRGRVCVVCGGGGRIVVVDVAARPPRTWVVNPPPEMELVGVHILHRVSLSE
ncbi:hypothetical protein RHGRI_019457 [Rhododendron griersonianum]|uniref:F-box/kelch-repeat protein SKIP25-like n=1 Tax=Rhododendron griersonianum TaxID=479676 RepID=A0AAV6JGZ9_9ERIC|nr:hypothetical protein RHGRI_019457 [Rhododendron griersonianum]